MGIDAKMFVRIPAGAQQLNEQQVHTLAVKMAKTLGHKKFFIEHEALVGVEKQMFGDKPHHALSIIDPIKNEKDAEDHGLDASHIGHVVWTQDGDPIVADLGEQFIRVHLWSRYYGPGYERGDWPGIYAVMRFLWLYIPQGQTWYGGDSSGACAEHFDVARAEAMESHYMSCGHEPYRAYFGRGVTFPNCRCCRTPMHDVGGGSDVTFYSCDGCGWKMVRYKNGRDDKWGRPEKEFFDMTKD